MRGMSFCIAGAVLAHVLAFAFVFLKGFVIGEAAFMSPTSANDYGLKGGLNGIVGLIALYFITFGVVPIAISIGGAVLGVLASITSQDEE